MGPPDEEKRRPVGGAVPQDDQPGDGEASTQSITRRLIVAAELVAGQAERDERNYRCGWNDCVRMLLRPMFDHGVDVGRAQAVHEIDEDWRYLAEMIRNEAKYVGLMERRWGPGGRAHFAGPRPGDFPGVASSKRGAA